MENGSVLGPFLKKIGSLSIVAALLQFTTLHKKHSGTDHMGKVPTSMYYSMTDQSSSKLKHFRALITWKRFITCMGSFV